MRVYAGRRVGPIYLGVGFNPVRFAQMHAPSNPNVALGFYIGLAVGLVLVAVLLSVA
jgi:hypothetical protein